MNQKTSKMLNISRITVTERSPSQHLSLRSRPSKQKTITKTKNHEISIMNTDFVLLCCELESCPDDESTDQRKKAFSSVTGLDQSSRCLRALDRSRPPPHGPAFTVNLIHTELRGTKHLNHHLNTKQSTEETVWRHKHQQKPETEHV